MAITSTALIDEYEEEIPSQPPTLRNISHALVAMTRAAFQRHLAWRILDNRLRLVLLIRKRQHGVLHLYTNQVIRRLLDFWLYMIYPQFCLNTNNMITTPSSTTSTPVLHVQLRVHLRCRPLKHPSKSELNYPSHYNSPISTGTQP